ncbi:alpha/beta fold hydrolase [Halapricum sp. CBA1109]|uniref:alpha/beta fold hydrolase n=1 Tax=Halapricum sp. CBA1109 TaxID=2668068 RepID=UPI001E608049|nr:alpha/beta hydrolase [Halapricum sp. CBA1109]
MEFDRFGDDEDPSLLFVLGWGNRTHHEPVRWLIDHLSEEFRVHTATLPVHVTDVQAEWVRPVERYAADLDSPALLGHSAGGLTAAHTDIDARTRTYLSPWWGYPPATRGPHIDLVAKIPLDAKLLPSGINATALGAHATERQVEETPSRVSPRFLRATRAAHESVPEADEDASSSVRCRTGSSRCGPSATPYRANGWSLRRRARTVLLALAGGPPRHPAFGVSRGTRRARLATKPSGPWATSLG